MIKDYILKLKGPIVVLGASGFVGTNLLHSILEYRDDCIGVYHINQWRIINIPEKNVQECDLTDADKTRTFINSIKPATVFNLMAYGAYSYQDNADKIYKTNFLSTVNLLNILKDTDCSAYIHAGSSSEYGSNCYRPDEESELLPNSDYAVSKVACSYLIKHYADKFDLPAINLRLYSVYGPWEEPNRLIPNVVLNGIEGRYTSFVSPEISRDFVYIDDVVKAFVLVALRAKTVKGKSFNIATGKQTTIKELAQIAKNLFNIESEPFFSNMENRKWDLQNWVGKADLALQLLGWKAEISLEDGLNKTKEWFLKNSQFIEFYKNFDLKNYEKRKKISAVIACYKDEQAIPVMYERLVKVFEKIKTDYEIIFVNDASPDKSEDVILELSSRDKNVVGITHSRNFGSQSAFISGMDLSKGDAVVLLDGDLQDPPELIENFYNEWIKGFDVVYGVRIKREMSPFSEMFYKMFYQIFSQLADINIPKHAGDFSLMDRKVVNELLKLPEKDVFLRGLRAWVGFSQTGVPYVRPERLFGRSTNNLLKNIWWAKKGIFSFSNKPLEYISYLSLSVFGFTLVAGIVQFVVRLYRPDIVPTGLTTVLLVILFLGGIQLFSISIIGEYIVKIIDETKKRPRYIRKSIIADSRKFEDARNIEDFINKRRSL
jgi:nucleoside-diphosphate-sugar epimerase/glycosyltransferase involved in cell wall biosynthesis